MYLPSSCQAKLRALNHREGHELMSLSVIAWFHFDVHAKFVRSVWLKPEKIAS